MAEQRQDAGILLLQHLAEQYKHYKAEILPLRNDEADDYRTYDAEFNEFLENLWDVIAQHFDDRSDNERAIFENLCAYDKRNPLYFADDDYSRKPRENCSCDNCFYGRDRLAIEILRLRSDNG